MRTFMLTVTGLVFGVAACSSYGTSVVEVANTHAAVASVSVAVPPSIVAGHTARAVATPKDANGAVLTGRSFTWFTSSASIASVTDSGVVSAVSPGNAVVSAVSEGVAGQASMSVMPPSPTPIATVTVAVNPSAVLIGQKAVATATMEDSSGNTIVGRTVTWVSSNTNIATVAATGDVTAVGSGTAMIIASSEGKTDSSALNVSAPPTIPVASVSVSPTSATLQIGGSQQLSVVTRDANNNVLTGRVVTWGSANAAIATVSSSGLVRAVTAGSTTVTASSEGQTASAAITVALAPVAAVTVSPATNTLQIGGTVQLSAVTRDAGNNVLSGRAITWSSSNAVVATVSTSGFVTALTAGTATVTASSEGKTGSSTVTVNPAPVPVGSVSVTPTSATVQVGASVQLSAATLDANNNPLTGRLITWSSSNPAVSSVSSSGLVRGIAAGNATISALSETKTGTAAISVTAATPPPPGGVEPAGMTVVTERSFSSLNEDGWTNTGGSDYSIQSDAAAPKSPSSVGQILFPAGFGAGNAPAVLEKVFGGTNKTIYVSFWLKLSSNWVGQQAGVNKIFHFWIGGSNHLFLNAAGTGNGSLTAEVWLQGIVAGGNFDAGKTADFAPNLGASGQLVRGQWAHWEMVFTGNSSGASDGSVEWWLDGVKVGSYSGIQFVSGAGTWQSMEWSPTWGGSGGTVPADQFMSIDHIYISGKP